jgi:hypothetical protein
LKFRWHDSAFLGKGDNAGDLLGTGGKHRGGPFGEIGFIHEFFECGKTGEEALGEVAGGVGGHAAANADGGDAEGVGDARDAGGGFAVGGLRIHAAFAGDD